MSSLFDLIPVFIIGGGLVCVGINYLYWWYRGGSARCIKCGIYTWEGMSGLNDAGDIGNVHPGSCPISVVTEESTEESK